MNVSFNMFLTNLKFFNCQHDTMIVSESIQEKLGCFLLLGIIAMNKEGYEDYTAELAIANVERQRRSRERAKARKNHNKQWQKNMQRDSIPASNGKRQETHTQNRWVVYANGVSRMARLKQE